MIYVFHDKLKVIVSAIAFPRRGLEIERSTLKTQKKNNSYCCDVQKENY